MTELARLDPQVEDLLDGLQPIAAELGVGATLAIVRHYGGARVYVPRRWTPDLDLNTALGGAAAAALCARFGPERIDIPRNPFSTPALQRFVAELRRDGLPNNRIALVLGLSWRTVTRLTGEAPAPRRARRAPDPRQIDIEELLGPRNA